MRAVLSDSDDTIQNYSDIFELHFMCCRYNSDNRSTEETGREGERESKRCRAEMEKGCHAKENDKSPFT